MAGIIFSMIYYADRRVPVISSLAGPMLKRYGANFRIYAIFFKFN